MPPQENIPAPEVCAEAKVPKFFEELAEMIDGKEYVNVSALLQGSEIEAIRLFEREGLPAPTEQFPSEELREMLRIATAYPEGGAAEFLRELEKLVSKNKEKSE